MITESGLLTPELRHSDSGEAAVDGARGHGDVAWFVMRAPSFGEFRQVFGALGLPDHAAVTIHRRLGRVASMLTDRVLLVTLPDLERSTPAGPVVGLQLVVGQDFVVAVAHGMSEADVDQVRRDAERSVAGGDQAHGMTGWAFLAGLVAVTFQQYEEILDAVEDSIDEIAADVFPDPSDDVVKDIYMTSERVMLAARVLRPIARGLSTLLAELGQRALGDNATRTVVRLRSEAQDLVERTTWMGGTLASLNDAVFGLGWRKANALAGEQAAAGTQLTAYAAMLAVPAVIFGLYGTNFQHVPDLLKLRWGYPVMLAATLVIEVLLWLRFRRRGWL
jgi:magnesium transporter